MNRSQRLAKRQQVEAQRQGKKQLEERRRVDAVARDAKIRTVLDRSTPKPQRLVEDALEAGDQHVLFREVRVRVRNPNGLTAQTISLNAEQRVPYALLLRTLAKAAPRLIDPSMMVPVTHLARFPWVRSLQSWKPSGKSLRSIFRSLAEHLLARFPTPHFLWTAFYTQPAVSDLAALAAHVAGGNALYDKVKDKALPLPLTRKMCHEFLSETTAEYTFVRGLRRIQVRTHGGDQRLYKIWADSRVAVEIQEAPEEDFWDTVLRFFARNPMLDSSQIEPLIDYIGAKRLGNRDFSMKGRQPQALLRDMQDWHGELARQKVITGTVFKPSGFASKEYERTYKEGGRKETVLWSISEILTAKELATEGRTLHHCVYSYAGSIERLHTSIWSLKSNNERQVTIEVTNPALKIVQYRGRYNASPKAREFQILQAWATDNGLSIASSKW
jgi:hypothetical protein